MEAEYRIDIRRQDVNVDSADIGQIFNGGRASNRLCRFPQAQGETKHAGVSGRAALCNRSRPPRQQLHRCAVIHALDIAKPVDGGPVRTAPKAMEMIRIDVATRCVVIVERAMHLAICN